MKFFVLSSFVKSNCYSCYTLVESYVKSLDQPALLDLVVQPASEDVVMNDVEDLRPSKRKVIYNEVMCIMV